MLHMIKDIPDWMMGTALASAAWFGVSYSVLAPRAMDHDKVQTIIPECALELDKKQDIYLADALEKAQEAARYAKNEAAQRLRRRQNVLRDQLGKIATLDQLNSIYDSSGLGDLLGAMGMRTNVPVPDMREVHAELDLIARRLRDLNIPESISIPKAPNMALVQSCACAASEAIAGKRTAYTISMASFRTITPDKLLTVKADLNKAFETDICNATPWENYS